MRLILSLLLSLGLSGPVFAQMSESDLPPEPHPAFAEMWSLTAALEAYQDAQAAYEEAQATKRTLAEAKTAYDAIIDQMVEDGPDAATPEEGWPIMQAFVEAQVAHDTAVAAYTEAHAAYQSAREEFAPHAVDETATAVADLSDEVELLNGLDQEVAGNGQRIVDLELALQNYAAAVNTLLTLLCDRLDERVYDEVCATFTTAAQQMRLTLEASD